MPIYVYISYMTYISYNPPAPCAGIAIQSLFFLNNKHIPVDTHASIIEDWLDTQDFIIEDRMDTMSNWAFIFGVNVFVTNGSQKIDLAAILAGN